MKRDLISLKDFSSQEILNLLKSTAALKKQKGRCSTHLQGKTIGLLFQKPSNRTRVSFEVGVRQLGGDCLYLGPEEINLGKRETTADVARTLSRYLDGIVARTFLHSDVEDLAKYSSVPVINGLSDLFHPCQALADIFTVQENFGSMRGKVLAFVGDGNNVCHSLMIACAKVGIHVHVATPAGYAPDARIVTLAKRFARESGSRIVVMRSPQDAVKGAQVIYADVWVSMGQEAETKKRLKIFQNYQINAKLCAPADPKYIFMHCLPAHRGEEVTADIIDGTHSVIFDQAENRLHVQKAVLLMLLGKKKQDIVLRNEE